MAFPSTMAEMKAQGYIFTNVSACHGCAEEIEWWITPQGKNIPMNPMLSETSEAIAHWATCSEADHFKR